MRTTLWGLASIAVLFTACKKEAGEGGKAEIHGVVYMQEYNDNTGIPIGHPHPAAEQRVYIIYGDNGYADDDTRTEPDGTFRFPWLRKGDYQVYVVSECDPDIYVGCTKSVLDAVEITDRKEVVVLDTMLIENW